MSQPLPGRRLTARAACNRRGTLASACIRLWRRRWPGGLSGWRSWALTLPIFRKLTSKSCFRVKRTYGWALPQMADSGASAAVESWVQCSTGSHGLQRERSKRPKRLAALPGSASRSLLPGRMLMSLRTFNVWRPVRLWIRRGRQPSNYERLICWLSRSVVNIRLRCLDSGKQTIDADSRAVITLRLQ